LHDIGKSQISFDILEKQTALDEREYLIVKSHPILGYEMMCGTPGLQSETMDMILHHHEYVDGSGYPHGLQGSQVSDLNRMITIADVFAALIEPRSYKAPLSPSQALDVLYNMGAKLDKALVRAFAPLTDRVATYAA
jgi:HD-GYP domain-containing protein (c-di-GMP phosphodiesterase class II)